MKPRITDTHPIEISDNVRLKCVSLIGGLMIVFVSFL